MFEQYGLQLALACAGLAIVYGLLALGLGGVGVYGDVADDVERAPVQQRLLLLRRGAERHRPDRPRGAPATSDPSAMWPSSLRSSARSDRTYEGARPMGMNAIEKILLFGAAPVAAFAMPALRARLAVEDPQVAATGGAVFDNADPRTRRSATGVA